MNMLTIALLADAGAGVGKDFDPRACFRSSSLVPHAFAFKDEPGTDVLEVVTQLKGDMTNAMSEMKEAIKKRDAEIKQFGAAREATGSLVEKIDGKVTQLVEDYKGLLAEHEELKSEHTDLMKRAKRPGFGGGADEEQRSLGEVFTSSDAYDRMLKGNSQNSDAVKVKSFLKQLEQKTLSGTSDALGGALIDPFRVPGLFAAPQRPFRLRDLLTVNPTTERSVEFVKETNFYQLYTQVASSAAAAQADIVVDNARGFFDGQTITIAPGLGAEESRVVSAVDHDTNTITVTVNLTNTHAVDVEIVADEFIYTPETKTKPKAAAKFALETESMKTLAHWLPASRQILRNRAMLSAHINTRLLQGLELSEEQQILYGDGTSNQLQGLMTNANAQSYAWSSGTVGDTKLDAIRRAMTLAKLANYPVDGVVVGPSDWEDIELAKGSDGHYIWVNVASGGDMRLWRAPIVESNAMNAGDFLVGAFALGTALWDGEQASIRVSEHHENYFIKNMVAILAEQDACMTTYRPEAFVVGDFDSAPV